MTGRRQHWDDTYRAKDETRVSWFQETPGRSLALIEAAAPDKDLPILDVGGGTSRLAGALLDRGYSDLSVLDISEVALDCAKGRLGDRAARVSWITTDVTQWVPARQWQVWHDRALFHFLTEDSAQQAYVTALARGTRPGASVIIAGFSPSGPERCSGLPVIRHSTAGLAECLGKNFTLVGETREIHRTPAGTDQDFLYVSFRRQL
ncbi:MAG TPA: class I SAM-dependent methyltransferase [Rhizomicrobium sp.]|nr:class I SAM-dependent methyltransferase [Rhizomicrobium sp.]